MKNLYYAKEKRLKQQNQNKKVENQGINKVYEEFYDEKQSAVLVRWVITENMVQGKVQVKA